MREMFKKEMERRNISNKDMAKKVDISEGQLSSNLNGKTSKTMGFSLVVKLIKALFPEQERELVAKHIPTIDKAEYIKQALEYAAFHKYHEITQLIFENELCKKPSLKDWVFCYKTFNEYQCELINYDDFLSKIRNLHLKDMELRLMRDFAETRNHHINKHHPFVKEMATNLISDAKKVKDEFIRQYYLVRVNIMIGYSHLHTGNLKESMKYSEYTISTNIDQTIVAHAYHSNGLAKMFDCPEKSLEDLYYAKSYFLNIQDTTGAQNVQDSINALKNHYSQPVEEEECSDDISRARNEFVKGNVSGAKYILSSCNLDDMSIYYKAFYKYVLGMVESDEDELLKSIQLFKKCGQGLFGRLPCIELVKLGTKELIVETIYGNSLTA